MRAIVVNRLGGPECLEPTGIPAPEPADGELLVAVSAAGVNYADTHQAEGSYLVPTELPFVPGSEVAGTDANGNRVVALVRGGGYAQWAAAPAESTFRIPDGVDDGAALALVLQGLTAWHLLRTCAHLQAGETVVVHAAAGGVGTLAVQLARMWGAGRIIGTASSPDKRRLAVDLGADTAVDSAPADAAGMTAALRDANGGRRVDVVLEMAGGAGFDGSLAALAPFGRLVTYGMAGRAQPAPVDPRALLSTSRAVIGFWLAHCLSRPEMLREPMAQLLAATADGRLRPVIGGTYPLSDARRAHEDLRGRTTIGKLLLDPAR